MSRLAHSIYLCFLVKAAHREASRFQISIDGGLFVSRRRFFVSFVNLCRIAVGALLAVALVAGVLPAWSSPQQALADNSVGLGSNSAISPAADKQGVLKLWQQGGAVTKLSARAALLGDDVQLKEFIDSGQYDALKQDYRTTAIQISLVARANTRKAAEAALADGSWQVLQKFVVDGWKAAWLIDDRKDAFSAVEDGTPSVKTAAKNAIAAGDAAIQEFVATGKTAAETVDKRKEIYKLFYSSPTVKKVAGEVIQVNTLRSLRRLLAIRPICSCSPRR
ncbi:hypothetical protein RSal33209_2192 [Renibacterium salmoninarum ATCC 33209]|uniref:Uncharacterized protein n=1 Tax=Renibacterium salmoninarum (strain ATCC 33209 / DSM 20767 / JCM 11484 / NBRC 15589 / NCIMB 2235) TaxID=288705 RepID=A9WSY6_RENSM|nr:ALF repeat-containing protein [Renibacterium salmoninarum]ABY23924.1 hypothetical protein RSal33209_2192 [Renibacterium salmoninarum ATCC 33209]